MRNSSITLSAARAPRTAIGEALAQKGVNVILAVEDNYALLQCQVSSAVAARMLAPLKGSAVGQFRVLADNLVEIDASVTIAMATKMLAARGELGVAHGQILHLD